MFKLNWQLQKKCKILWKAEVWELMRISEIPCYLTHSNASLRQAYPLLEAIWREVEEMLPQIRLIQAVDRPFPASSGPQKQGLSRKGKGLEGSSGPVAFQLGGNSRGRCVCTWFSHLSKPAKLHPQLLGHPGSVEDLNHCYMPSSSFYRSQNQAPRNSIRHPKCQRCKIRTRVSWILR